MSFSGGRERSYVASLALALLTCCGCGTSANEGEGDSGGTPGTTGGERTGSTGGLLGSGGTSTSMGGAASTGGSSAAGGVLDTGGDATSGGSTGGSDSKCPDLEQCGSLGGRSNVCGGVIADSRFLSGTGFDDFEGARVVSQTGQTTIKDGAFSLYIGYFAGCPAPPTAYRIESSANGRCDEGDDSVYIAENHPPGIGADLVVTGDDPGTPASCAEFSEGLDLDLSLSPDCLPRCGSVKSALFDDTGTLLATDPIFLDGSLTGHTFTSSLTRGHSYTVEYYYSPSMLVSGCSGSTELWQRTLVATEGVNELELTLAEASSRGDCF